MDTLTLADLRDIGVDLTAEELASALNPAEFVARRTTLGGPAPSAMRGEILAARERLQADITLHEQLTDRFMSSRQGLVGESRSLA